jgi:DNA-binding NarL/FixJ family response regulator
MLADDHPMMCAALREMLAPDHDVIGCVQDGRTLVNSAAELKPDLVVLDVGLPVLNGLDASSLLGLPTGTGLSIRHPNRATRSISRGETQLPLPLDSL